MKEYRFIVLLLQHGRCEHTLYAGDNVTSSYVETNSLDLTFISNPEK